MIPARPLLFLTLVMMFANSCEKDNATPVEDKKCPEIKVNPNISGTWSGISLFHGTTPISLNLYISSFNLVTADQAPNNPQTTGAGSYGFDGDSVVVRVLSNFNNNVYYHKLGLDDTKTKLSGYWYNEVDHSDGGTMSLEKQ